MYCILPDDAESSMINEQWTAKLHVAFFYIWLVFIWSWSVYTAHEWFDVIAISIFFLFTEMFWVMDYWLRSSTKTGNTRLIIVVERALTLNWHSRHATFGVMYVKEFKSTLFSWSCHVTLAFFLQTRLRYPCSAAEKWRTLDLDARSRELFISNNGRTRKYR